VLGVAASVRPLTPHLQPVRKHHQPLSLIPSHRQEYSCSHSLIVLGMIKSSLRRGVCSHSPAQSISRPLSVVASFSCLSHQRRQSSSKPPTPPNDGPANVPSSSVKTVGTPRSKDATTIEKRPGSESRLSRRKTSRDKTEHPAIGKEQWAISLPTAPSTQHLDPKGESLFSYNIYGLLGSDMQHQTFMWHHSSLTTVPYP
jgi:hypothetical protein